MSVNISNETLKIIYEFFNANKFLSLSDKKKINTLKSDSEVLNFLKENHNDKLKSVVDFCIKDKYFTEVSYNEISIKLDDEDKIEENDFLDQNIEKESSINSDEKIEDVSDDLNLDSSSIDEHKDNNVIDNQNIKEVIIDKNEELNKNKDFTEKYIRELISKWKNLYKNVPWDKVPKDDNQFYTEVQLMRFIDSWASDFILETQKKDGKIYSKILFKIAWEHEVQDITKPTFLKDKTENNLNIFFDTVRKYIWSTLGRLNADLKHVAQDSSFSLDYRNKTRDFRLSSLPSRCYWIPFPRYCIRLTSEWDNINLKNIELLPFFVDFLNQIIVSKRPWMVAFTWPTGSGKTTTIYWILNALDKDKLWIWAIEKPIESQIHWINQTEEDATERWDKAERYTNKEFMKSVLRQALDVIFVGEMRDSEETKQWVKTWLVGNKLITTFHTNSAVDTILRLREEWVTNNAIGNWVKSIIAQRLVQKVCPKCSKIHPESKKALRRIESLFKVSKIYCSDKLKELLDSLDDRVLNDLDRLEINFQKYLSFLSRDDLNSMVELLEENFEKYLSNKNREDRINFLLDLFKNYPEPEKSKWISEQIENANIKVAWEWCDYEYIKWDNSYACKDWYLTERVMIAEGLDIDKPVKKFIQDPDSKLNDLENFLSDKWFIDMKMYWYLLVLQWLTTLDKIDEVVEE